MTNASKPLANATEILANAKQMLQCFAEFHDNLCVVLND